MSRLIHYTYIRPGKEVDTYDHWLVIDEPDVKVMLMEEYKGQPLVIDGKIAAEPGASLLWFVFPGAWHDVGRFHLADDTWTGWYTNLCTPVEMRQNTWASTDLFLDNWMTPDGRHSWLDGDELTLAIDDGLLTEKTQQRIHQERRTIQSHIDIGAWPPRVAREMDLHDARGLVHN